MNGSSHLRSIVNQDGAAILDTELGSITTLNSTGAFVWQGLERGDSLETIIDSLAGAESVPKDIVERDVLEFVESLRTHRLLSH